ncbi:MAG: flagellar motor protein MotB [Desulfobacula sp.]|jgi:chemotaxis protein MotB
MAGEGGKKKEGNIIIKKVKKGGHGGHHGGAWKVAYADFVTAMMAFFLLMWLINSVKPETKEALSKYFKGEEIPTEGAPPTTKTDIDIPPDPDEMSEAIAKSMELEEDMREIVDQMLSEMKDQIIITLEDGSVRMEIVDKERNPLFASGSSELSESAKRIIKEMTKAMINVPNKVIIEGHTDAVNFSTTRYTNWELSTERASAARKVLESSGLAPERIAMVAGYASTIPFIKKNPNSPENRRISIVVLPPKKNLRALYKN